MPIFPLENNDQRKIVKFKELLQDKKNPDRQCIKKPDIFMIKCDQMK